MGVLQVVFTGKKQSKDFWGIIIPDLLGSKEIYFHKGDVVGTDTKFMDRNTMVEFEASQLEDGSIRATDVTGPNGRPLTFYKGTIGEFFRGHNMPLRDCTPVPLIDNRLQGFL